MARLFTAGAEWNNGFADGAVASGANAVISSASPRSGVYSYRASVSDSWSFAFVGAVGTTYLARSYYNLDALPSTGNRIFLLHMYNTGVLNGVRIEIDEFGQLFISTATSTVLGSGPSVATGQYFCIELAWNVAVGAADYAEARLNQTSFYSSNTLNITDTAPANLLFCNALNISSGGAYSDDIALNDSTGAAQNTWPGSGKIVLAKPISDNARTAGWVTGAGGTTSLFAAVKNTPPVGVADTGTATSQIRDATSEASASYDANLTTYTTLGIAAADTINVVVPMVATGAPVTTSSKQGLIGMASNPAIATVALGAGGTSGAFWSGLAAGTYPTGWKWSFGTTTYAPSVTLGSSPVARITQVTASTRIADVCALGMYIDYTPAVAAPTPDVAMALTVT